MSGATPNAKSVFFEALDKESPEELRRFLDEACGDDSELRSRVEDLLRSHRQAGEFLGGSKSDVPVTIDSSVAQEPDTRIGPYKLLQQLGEGGMGVVYMAEQAEPVKRRVALKLIKPGMDSRQVIARFEAERQALALMDHPNIAKVFDAATTDSGQPYFVMELVKGIPLTKYSDEQHLTPKERLKLFIPVCQAIQHAHQKGIIHRDLKPSNVLVALYDGEPVPKVIDFGVAKATSQQLTEKTMFTAVGQIVGTLEYMSPEQAQVNQLDVDTRSDIYSLGVLLYELLTGVTPLDRHRLQSAAFDEMIRIIREEEPPRPSLRLSTIDALPSIAANRRIEPNKLRSVVHGELDWIVMKALEKDRVRRYETATGFAADIQHFLDDEPVSACPPSAAYRIRKFSRRYRGPVTAAAVILLLLCLGLVGTSVGVIWARKAEREARHLAAANQELAQDERDARQDAENKSVELAKQLRVSTAMRLAGESQAIQREYPIRSLLLAIEAIEVTRRHDEPVFPLAHESLLNTVSMVRGQPLGKRDAGIMALAMTPDSRAFVTGQADGTVLLWDLAAVDPSTSVVPLRGHDSFVTSAVVSSDGRWLATGSWDKTVRLCDLSASDPASSSLELGGHGDLVSSLAISSDSRWLASGARDATARVWDLSVEDPSSTVRVFEGHESSVRVAFTPNGRYLVTLTWGAERKGIFRVWDFLAGPDSSPRLFEHDDATAMEVSPDSRWLVTAGRSGAVRLWDLTAEDPSLSAVLLDEHQGVVDSVAISPDGSWLVTGSRDKTARLWELDKSDLSASSHVLRVQEGSVAFVRISDDSRWVVTGKGGKVVRLWDLTAEEPAESPVVLRGHDADIFSLAISPDGNWLVTGCRNGEARLWDLSAKDTDSSSAVLRGRRGPSNLLFRLAISPDARWLVSGGLDHTVRVWDMTADDLTASRRDLPGHTDTIVALSISLDSRWLVTGSADATARRWDLLSGDPAASSLELTGHEGQINAVEMSPDGRWITTASDGTIRLWDNQADDPAQSPLVLRGHDGPVTSMAISADSHWLVTGSEDTTARLWNLAFPDPGGSAIVLSGHSKEIASVAISPDGRWVASGSMDATARLWDLSAEDVASSSLLLVGHAVELARPNDVKVVISPDSRWLITAGSDRTARLWNLTVEDPGTSSIALRGHTGRINPVAISPDSRWLITGSVDRTARLWELRSDVRVPTSIVLRGHEDVVVSAAISPDGRWIVTGTPQAARLWEFRTDSLIDRARRLAGRELTPLELDAHNLPMTTHQLATLLVGSLSPSHLLKRDLVEAILKESTVSAEVRDEAAVIAGESEENASRLNSASWSVVRRPGHSVDEYQKALLYAETACETKPDRGDYLNTLGVAQCRLGRFDQAVRTLTRANELNHSSSAADVAFLAMARYRLGQEEVAVQLLQQLRQLVNTLPPGLNSLQKSQEARTFLSEAESLLNAP